MFLSKSRSLLISWYSNTDLLLGMNKEWGMEVVHQNMCYRLKGPLSKCKSRYKNGGAVWFESSSFDQGENQKETSGWPGHGSQAGSSSSSPSPSSPPHQRERELGGPTMLVERSPAQRLGGRSYQRETLSLPHRLVLFHLTELYVQYVLYLYLFPNQKEGKPCIKMYFCAVLSCIESERSRGLLHCCSDAIRRGRHGPGSCYSPPC